MQRWLRSIAFILILLLLSLALPARAAAPLPIVVSFSILADMVHTIGGDTVSITTLVGPDGDSHSYQPTPKAVKAISGAKLVFINGLGFENWAPNLIKSAGYKGPVIITTTGIQPQSMIADSHGPAVSDPHAWQDLANGRRYVQTITAALIQALPADAAAIQARAAAYDTQLSLLDQQIRQQLAAIPEAHRQIVTSHDAFGYFGRAYGIKFLAAAGLNAEVEPSAQAIAKLSQQIKTLRVKQVFLETMTSPNLIQQIARDTGARLGGTLYSDSLSDTAGPAPTYLDMFQHNVPLLISAMQQNG